LIPKVLHVSTAKTWRGGEQQLIYLVEELRLKGIAQVVVCTKGSCVEEYCRHNNIPVFTSKKLLPIDPAFAYLIAKTARKHSVNLIHSHDAHAHTFSVMASTFFGAKPSIIVSRRVDFPIRKGFLSKWKYNHKSVKRILCVSDAIKDITSKGVRNSAVLRTVYSGIDLKRFENKPTENVLRKEYNIPTEIPIIGNVAALAPHKDYFTFLDVAKLASDKGFNGKFFIVGEGELKDELKAYTRKLGITDTVVFAGFRDDIPQVIPCFDIFLITSETEGLGTSILDAIACETPVVATTAGGIPEIIIHEKTGLTAPVKDAEGLFTNICRLNRDKELTKKLIAGATIHLQSFTKQATANKTLEIYQELL